MKNKIIFTFILVISLSLSAQTYNSFTPTKGEITFNGVSKITNKKLFNETLKIAKEKFKESLKKSLLKEENNKGKEQQVEEMVTGSANMMEMIYTDDSTQTYRQQFENSNVINIVLENGEVTNKYDRANILSNNIVLKVSEDKKNKKNINGYDCYKVVYEYKENGDDPDEDYMAYAGDTVYRREMWVTDQIKSLFHPVIFEKSILEKYYPLDILETQSDIKGFEKRYTLEEITLH